MNAQPRTSGVADQIVDDLPEAERVADQPVRNARRDVDEQLETFSSPTENRSPVARSTSSSEKSTASDYPAGFDLGSREYR